MRKYFKIGTGVLVALFVILFTYLGRGVSISATEDTLSFRLEKQLAPPGTVYDLLLGSVAKTENSQFQFCLGQPLVILEVETSGDELSIGVSPTTENLGVLANSSSYYAYGSTPSNPIVDGECTFTITNSGSTAFDVDISITDFTGGTTWNIVSGAPSSNEVRVTAYYSGQNPSSGLVLSNTPTEFYDGLAASGTIKWDFKIETGILSSEANQHTATITLVAVVED